MPNQPPQKSRIDFSKSRSRPGCWKAQYTLQLNLTTYMSGWFYSDAACQAEVEVKKSIQQQFDRWAIKKYFGGKYRSQSSLALPMFLKKICYGKYTASELQQTLKEAGSSHIISPVSRGGISKKGCQFFIVFMPDEGGKDAHKSLVVDTLEDALAQLVKLKAIYLNSREKSADEILKILELDMLPDVFEKFFSNNRRNQRKKINKMIGESTSLEKRSAGVGYFGVTKPKCGLSWLAAYQDWYVGSYQTKEEAARAYDHAKIFFTEDSQSDGLNFEYTAEQREAFLQTDPRLRQGLRDWKTEAKNISFNRDRSTFRYRLDLRGATHPHPRGSSRVTVVTAEVDLEAVKKIYDLSMMRAFSGYDEAFVKKKLQYPDKYNSEEYREAKTTMQPYELNARGGKTSEYKGVSIDYDKRGEALKCRAKVVKLSVRHTFDKNKTKSFKMTGFDDQLAIEGAALYSDSLRREYYTMEMQRLDEHSLDYSKCLNRLLSMINQPNPQEIAWARARKRESLGCGRYKVCFSVKLTKVGAFREGKNKKGEPCVYANYNLTFGDREPDEVEVSSRRGAKGVKANAGKMLIGQAIALKKELGDRLLVSVEDVFAQLPCTQEELNKPGLIQQLREKLVGPAVEVAPSEPESSSNDEASAAMEVESEIESEPELPASGNKGDPSSHGEPDTKRRKDEGVVYSQRPGSPTLFASASEHDEAAAAGPAYA